MNDIQKMKKNFRQSKKWKDFRKKIFQSQKHKDIITNKKLLSSANLHHCNLNIQDYKDLSDESHFLGLNKKTHEFIHWIYTYYRTDKDVINRIIYVLNLMYRINEM